MLAFENGGVKWGGLLEAYLYTSERHLRNGFWTEQIGEINGSDILESVKDSVKKFSIADDSKIFDP